MIDGRDGASRTLGFFDPNNRTLQIAPEGLHPPAVHIEVPAELGLAPLAQSVDVPDRGQIGQLVVPRLVERFPDRALGQLGVPAQYPHVVRQLVQVLARQRHADADRQSLPK